MERQADWSIQEMVVAKDRYEAIRKFIELLWATEGGRYWIDMGCDCSYAMSQGYECACEEDE